MDGTRHIYISRLNIVFSLIFLESYMDRQKREIRKVKLWRIEISATKNTLIRQWIIKVTFGIRRYYFYVSEYMYFNKDIHMNSPVTFDVSESTSSVLRIKQLNYLHNLCIYYIDKDFCGNIQTFWKNWMQNIFAHSVPQGLQSIFKCFKYCLYSSPRL